MPTSTRARGRVRSAPLEVVRGHAARPQRLVRPDEARQVSRRRDPSPRTPVSARARRAKSFSRSAGMIERGPSCACHMRRPEIARIVQTAFLHFDDARYALHAWTMMPNHVHVLFTPFHDETLSAILHSWKKDGRDTREGTACRARPRCSRGGRRSGPAGRQGRCFATSRRTGGAARRGGS